MKCIGCEDVLIIELEDGIYERRLSQEEIIISPVTIQKTRKRISGYAITLLEKEIAY